VLPFSWEILLQMGNTLLKGDIFIMITDLSLGRRGIDRLRKLFRLL